MVRNSHIDTARAHSALNAISSDCDRPKWVMVMTAAKSAGLDFEAVHDWSAGATNYKGRKDVLSVWHGLKESGGITAGTLFHAAKSEGWREEDSHQWQQQPKPTKASQKPTNDPLMIWDMCVSADAGHAYIVRKNGMPDGLRVYPTHINPLTIAGKNMAGWLVLPCFDLKTGDLQTLQFIPPDNGKKLNLPSCAVSGGFVVGSILPNMPCYLVEGIGQAWTANAATGAAAVVSFGSGRMETVAKELRSMYPLARLVLVADVGKRDHCRLIAEALGCGWISAPDNLGNNGDINDMAQRDGIETVAELLAGAIFPPVRFRLLSINDLMRLPPVQWIVKGVLPADGLAALYGASGSGKSFLVLDLLACIADGRDWFGRKVKQVAVTYCALEGQAGLKQRMQAYKHRYGDNAGNGLQSMPDTFNLLNVDDITGLAVSIVGSGGNGGVIVLDTLNRAAPGTDENSSQDMGAIIAAAKHLQSLVGGLVLLVHHTGKDSSKGLRGHSSLYAALDAAIEVTRDGERKSWKIAKAKDGRDGDAYPFKLEEICLGYDDDGDAITSCVVMAEESPADAVKRAKMPSGDNQRIVYRVISELLKQSENYGQGGAPVMRPCVTLEAVIDSACDRLACDEKRRPERTRQAITGMVASSVIVLREDWIWLP